MRLIGLLSYFDESPELLSECISRLRSVGIDHLVACDGAYDFYPAADPTSSQECTKAILYSCAGIGLTRLDKSGWSGNEVEKRNFMLEVALEVARDGDWLLVSDSDHMWESKGNFKDRLRTTESDVAEVWLADCDLDCDAPNWYPARLLYRAVPGMRYDSAHWRIRFPDGAVSTTLFAPQQRHTAKTLELGELLRVRHTVYHQPPERRERQAVYYDRRVES